MVDDYHGRDGEQVSGGGVLFGPDIILLVHVHD